MATAPADTDAEIARLRREVERLRAVEERLDAREAELRELLEGVNVVILRWDPQGRILFLNPFGLALFGYTEAELLGRSVMGTIVPETESSGRDLALMIADILEHPERYTNNENENMRRDGERVWITWRNRPVLDRTGRLREIVSIGVDTTERKRAEEALRHLTVHDNLTGLFNTRHLYETLPRLIRECGARGRPLSLIFADLDRFKRAVDTHGHLNGSLLIQQVAAVLRGAAPAGGFGVAYAGDEFVFVLPDHDRDAAVAVAERLREAVAGTTFRTDSGRAVRLTASFGVATCPDDATGDADLLASADQALFRVKARGRDAVGTSVPPTAR